MSNSEKKPDSPETQQQRWLRYGTNVVISSLVVVLLAAAVTALAQRGSRRLDTTRGGVYSLKPQTINIIKDLKEPIKIVSLYTVPEGGNTDEYAQAVDDLLQEYARRGRNIEVESIDPVRNPTKVDQLIADVTAKYGGEVKQYRELVESYGGVYDQIKKLAGEEAKTVQGLPFEQIKNDELAQALTLSVVTVQSFPKFLDNSQESIQRRLKQKPPDYKGAVGSIEQGMSSLSQMLGAILSEFKKSQDDPKAPEVFRQYMKQSLPRYEAIAKLADELLERVRKLGELKLDDLRQSLRARDAILVMGPRDMKVLAFEQVWRAPDQVSTLLAGDNKIKLRFAGEQQVSTAIVALSAAKKPKVAIVRTGGAPLASPGMPPFQQGGPMSEIASRLRAYNFEVVEKDLSGMYAMQAQMQGRPAEPEPSDEDIKDAIWVVLAFPSGGGPMGMSPPIAPKVQEHLKNGGSALIVFAPQVDPMSSLLKDWGIEVATNAVAVHERIAAGDAAGGDMIEEARRLPFIFDIDDYGDHLITRPLRSLDSFLVPLLPVKVSTVKGYKTTGIVPIPQRPASWGEIDIEALQNGENVSYNADRGDVAGPFFGGAASEAEAGNRLVVIGCPVFMFDRYLREPDPNLLRRGYMVSRFPANGELFMNSVYWLARMETMIAISPSAMEVSRIGEMSAGALRAWRVGALLVGLPGAVIVAGLMVYLKRRD